MCYGKTSKKVGLAVCFTLLSHRKLEQKRAAEVDPHASVGRFIAQVARLCAQNEPLVKIDE